MNVPNLARDDVLAMAATYLRLQRSEDPGETTRTLEQALRGSGQSPPATRQDAYGELWRAYQGAFPERAERLASSKSPNLPLPAGAEPRGVRALLDDRNRASSDLFAVLYDSSGRLRCGVARALGKDLLRGSEKKSGSRRGLDLLFEATLRGDQDSAYLLCVLHLPRDLRVSGDPEATDLAQRVQPGLSLRLAAATALIARDEVKGADAVLERLKERGHALPKDEAEAYQLIRDALLERLIRR